MNIKEGVQFVVTTENFRTKQDLDKWCGDMGKKKLYLYVKRLAPEHWEKIKAPENCVRAHYQLMLTGYKIFKE